MPQRAVMPPPTFTVIPVRRLSFAASASTRAARPSVKPGDGVEPVSIVVTKCSISARSARSSRALEGGRLAVQAADDIEGVGLQPGRLGQCLRLVPVASGRIVPGASTVEPARVSRAIGCRSRTAVAVQPC
jgi:hypothetical protein